MQKALISLVAILLTFFWSPKVLSGTLTVAVIDTGIGKHEQKLCKQGHKSFLGLFDNPLKDEHGHGSHVAGLINRNAEYQGDYCLVSLKYYSDKATGTENLINMKAAIRYAININVKAINISGGGIQADQEEMELIKEALDKKIKVVVAAGNEKSDLDKNCNYFPACYDPRIIIVGNDEVRFNKNSQSFVKRRNPSSNYGYRVSRWEMGTDVASSNGTGGETLMTGTSQATGIATGKIIKEMLRK